MRSILAVLCLALLSSCSSKRTQYQKYDKEEGGYSVQKFGDDLYLSRFEANSLTKRSQAETFAKFRSLEACREDGKKYSHILAVNDRSGKKKITRSDGNAWGPSYYYGMSPFYSRYGGLGFSTGINVINSRSWEETLVYPNIEVIYHCAEKIFEPEIAMREVPAEEMKHLVKDLKGGIQVEDILPGSPNNELKEQDIIVKADGKRIMKGHELLSLFKDGPAPVKLEVLREGERKQVLLKAEDVTQEVIANLRKLKDKACDYEDVKEKSSLCKEKI